MIFRKPLLGIKSYYLFSFAIFLQSVACGLVQVSLFEELYNSDAHKIMYGVVYAMSFIPMLIVGVRSDWLIQKVSAYKALLAPSIALIVTAVAVICMHLQHSIVFLTIIELIASAALTISFPIYQRATKLMIGKGLNLTHAVRIEALLFSGNAIIGLGMGSIFFSQAGPQVFMCIIALLFSVSVIFMKEMRLGDTEILNYQSACYCSLRDALRTFFSGINKERNTAPLCLMPLLTLATVPLIASLPAISRSKIETTNLLHVDIALPLMLLFARSLGQLAGPMFSTKFLLQKIKQSPIMLLFLIILFPVLYIVAFNMEYEQLALLTIFLAHVVLNILWTHNYMVIQSSYSENEIGFYASLQAAFAQSAAIFSSLFGTFLLQYSGTGGVIIYALVMMIGPIYLTIKQHCLSSNIIVTT